MTVVSMSSPQDIGKRIRRAREEASLSQEEVARRLDPPRSHASVSDMERGVTRVGAIEIAQLARMLGKPTLYFYGEEGTAAPAPSAFYARGGGGASLDATKKIDEFKERVRNLSRRSEGDTRDAS